MNPLTVHIGGVPEHFNYPWYLLLKSKELQKDNINLRWQDFEGGTGAMVQSLVHGDIDLALMLTEGVVKAICDGAPIKLIQYFVSSPLVWGVHTHPV
ncbi:MAG TPA: ABC transporter substrate-binding protein, partial [Flavobacteriaceae bacterium]|nr:ABC transporter substrate-binding protein [Flavobacteriaceae bacterium]